MILRRPAVAVFILILCCAVASAQTAKQFRITPVGSNVAQPATKADSPESGRTTADTSKTDGEESESPNSEATKAAAPQFRVERLPLDGGTELLTIFGRLDGMRGSAASAPEVPLISVVRDTLSDASPENDRLRYVWMLTYTRPNLLKRIASAIPFLYQHVGNQSEAYHKPPRPILDLANPTRQTWNHFFWSGMQNIFLDSYGIPVKASTRTYRRNAADYRAGHVMQALSILDTYEKLRQTTRDESELLALAATNSSATEPVNDAPVPLLPAPAFTTGEMLELRARLILSNKTFGGLLGPDKFADTVIKRTMSSLDNSGHNWEMLRQRAEAEGLYFDPLTMPGGQATHAILWIARNDLQSQATREFHDRFLNIKNPWSDARLQNWHGYSRTFYFDADSRIVDASYPGARPVEMIPLALYGLDHPKIPALLIDFRDHLNPKKREMTRRVFSDLAKNIFSLSNFGNLPYFAGRKFYDFVTGRRGMDLNQPTRLRSYSELKLLLSFNSTIDPSLRREIERRVQSVSLNPLNNDNEAEVRLARQQYDALLEYAGRPDGLSAKIERDRQAEMVPLEHGRAARFFFNLGNVLSLGRYVHRERATPELYARLDLARRLDRHAQFLKEVARSSPLTDVAWDIATVKNSLEFFAAEGKGATGSAAKAVATIFSRTLDAEARQLCLEALSKINTHTARAELLRIYQQQPRDSELRAEVAKRLRHAVATDERIRPSEVRTLLNQVGAP